MQVLIVVEQTPDGYSAFSPDVEGCVAAGATREEVERTMREALELHFDGLRADGQEVPAPHCYATFVQVPT